MIRQTTPALLLAAALGLAACSGQDPADPPVKAEPDAPAAPQPPAPLPQPPVLPSPPDSPTVGGDGSQIQLSTLTAAEVAAANLPGELACGFATSTIPTLLIAKGNVASKDPAIGVVKVGDYVERVAAPGGFDAMLKGGTFTGQGKTLRIAITGPAVGGGESPPAPATLTYQRADGAERTFAGTWTCGP